MKNPLATKLSKTKYWVQQHPILSASLMGALSFIVLQVISGIVGNSAYDFTMTVVIPWLKLDAPISNLTLVFVALFALLVGIVLSRLFPSGAVERFDNLSISKLSIYSNVIHSRKVLAYYKLMGSINQHIQTSLCERTEANLDHFINNYFLAIFHHLDPKVVNGGGILLVDETAPEWLYFWRMSPDQPVSPKRFYIGPKTGDLPTKYPRGVAGLVFLDGKARVVNILDPLTGEADHPSFHRFDLVTMGYPRSIVPYTSFVSLPVRWNSRVVAVLCIESQERETFDAESIKHLQPIADQLGTILFLFGKIKLQVGTL